jgi:hypothetical protein
MLIEKTNHGVNNILSLSEDILNIIIYFFKDNPKDLQNFLATCKQLWSYNKININRINFHLKIINEKRVNFPFILYKENDLTEEKKWLISLDNKSYELGQKLIENENKHNIIKKSKKVNQFLWKSLNILLAL